MCSRWNASVARIPRGESRLELLIRFGQLSLGRGSAALVLGGQFHATQFELGLGFPRLLLQSRLEQHVVDHADDRVAELSQLVGVERDLRIGPESIEVRGIDRRGCLAAPADTARRYASRCRPTLPAMTNVLLSASRVRIADFTRERHLDGDDLEIFRRVAGGITCEHGPGQLPRGFLGSDRRCAAGTVGRCSPARSTGGWDRRPIDTRVPGRRAPCCRRTTLRPSREAAGNPS